MHWNDRKKAIVSALPMFTCYMYCLFRNKWFIELNMDLLVLSFSLELPLWS